MKGRPRIDSSDLIKEKGKVSSYREVKALAVDREEWRIDGWLLS